MWFEWHQLEQDLSECLMNESLCRSGGGGGERSLFFLPLKIQRQRTRARTHLWGRSLRFLSAGCLSTGRDYGMEETRGGRCCLAKWPQLNSPKTTGDEVNPVVWSGMGRFWSQQSDFQQGFYFPLVVGDIQFCLWNTSITHIPVNLSQLVGWKGRE